MCSCSVDVNELASSSSSDVSSAADTDSEPISDVFYSSEEDTESAIEIESKVESEQPVAFDESKYPAKYVSGSAEITLTADALYGSKEVGTLKSGEKVSVVNSDVTEYCFVYSASIEKFGYVRTVLLADSPEETTIGETKYIKPLTTIIYSDESMTAEKYTAVQNDIVTVIVKFNSGVCRIADKNGEIGYISADELSDKKIKETPSSKAASSKQSKKKNQSSTVSSEVSSTVSSEVSSAPESSGVSSKEETVSGLYTGKGEPPENYTVYIVDVDVGYLSLRDVPSADKSKVIGELYYEDKVYILDTSGEFWYAYSPALGMYGYVTGNSDYLYPEEWY